MTPEIISAIGQVLAATVTGAAVIVVALIQIKAQRRPPDKD